ncbi:Flp pilus assembly protein CpaB [Aquisalibacillus elongatus]|uniref:Flp pilus assembly protein CpaB n=1 Tax=Aquisalibacillus elongatus TaxID=485577 RepID=A0A3N5C1A1_9BACI|nr:Flp pilus assembly protein CpaB [Aquisalibacillus elongatus]RPF55848.1 Flp pilus assembly protein CpaB [Aquisalibacillus elongatus]
MKSKKIWIWAVVFGLMASLSLYFLLFTQDEAEQPQTQDTNQINQEEEADDDDEQTNDSEEESDEEVKSETTEKNEMLEIEDGKRAISIEVSEVEGVSGFIEPGDFVDLVTIMNAPSDEEAAEEDIDPNQHNAATLLLQNVRVLAIGHAIHSKEEARNYRMVTLEVDPNEGLHLGFATKWNLYLMLRGEDDNEVYEDRTHVHEDELHEGVFR